MQGPFGFGGRRTVGKAEDRRHDDVEGELLREIRESDGLPDRPRLDPLGGGALDALAVRGDSLAVEPRHEQRTLPLVSRTDRGQHGIGTDDGPKGRLPCSRRRDGRVGGHDRLDVRGIAQDHRRPGPARETVGQHVPRSAASANSTSPCRRTKRTEFHIARGRLRSEATGRIVGSSRGPAGSSSPVIPTPDGAFGDRRYQCCVVGPTCNRMVVLTMLPPRYSCVPVQDNTEVCEPGHQGRAGWPRIVKHPSRRTQVSAAVEACAPSTFPYPEPLPQPAGMRASRRPSPWLSVSVSAPPYRATTSLSGHERSR